MAMPVVSYKYCHRCQCFMHPNVLKRHERQCLLNARLRRLVGKSAQLTFHGADFCLDGQAPIGTLYFIGDKYAR